MAAQDARPLRARKPVDLTAMLWLIGPFLVMDWLELFGRYYVPDELGRFSCFVMPFAKLSVPLVSHRLVDFAQGQCAGQPHEPMPSIVFYMLKIAIVLVAGVAMAFWMYLIPAWLLPSRLKRIRSEALAKRNANIAAIGGILGDIKRVGPTLCGLALFSFVIASDTDTPPSHFGRAWLNKIVEDFACVAVFVIVLMVIATPLSYISYGLKRTQPAETQ
ncbi:MAG: hypothetical protein WA734_17470 [Candidatus Acidiferrales bacterium]